VAAPGRATWHADVSMTSSGGSGPQTSAVGPADVSVDWSTVKGVRGQRVPLVSLALRLIGGPLGSGRIRKKKRSQFGSESKVVMGRLKAQQARLGSRGLARPAAQQAGSGRWANWLILGLAALLGPRRLMASSFRLLLLAGLGCLCSFSSC
jgi:hypothetical protein